tara:strand:+ start:24839 stop:25414 length:576 start_codon:yes stop_codon:yes gene_type:complete
MKTVTITYYNVESRKLNYEGEQVWMCETRHDKITDRAEAEAILAKKKADWTDYLNKSLAKQESKNDVQDRTKELIAINEWRITEDVKVFTHASHYGWSDVHAYEIVKVISDKTIEVREMITDHSIKHLDVHGGGFCGHVENQRDQKVTYKSDPEAPVVRIRRKKNDPELWVQGNFKFRLETKPYAFHDYNF